MNLRTYAKGNKPVKILYDPTYTRYLEYSKSQKQKRRTAAARVGGRTGVKVYWGQSFNVTGGKDF